jgi:hypothetical protein
MVPQSFGRGSIPNFRPVRALLIAFALASYMAAGSFAQERPESLQGPSVASRALAFDAPASEFAGRLIDVGLVVQMLSLTWTHPLSFMGFILIGCPLMGAGIPFFLHSLVVHETV